MLLILLVASVEMSVNMSAEAQTPCDLCGVSVSPCRLLARYKVYLSHVRIKQQKQQRFKQAAAQFLQQQRQKQQQEKQSEQQQQCTSDHSTPTAAGKEATTAGAGTLQLTVNAMFCKFGKAAQAVKQAVTGGDSSDMQAGNESAGVAAAAEPAANDTEAALQQDVIDADSDVADASDLVEGIWQKEGFGFSKLEPGLVSDIYLALGRQRWSLQRGMQLLEQADGHVSVDHVIQTAKRVKGDSKAMLIACGATGNVLDWWFTTSTSLYELVPDLKALNERQDSSVLVVTMDDVNTMEGPLKEGFGTDAKYKMDVGHVIFSRLGKLLNKSHGNYRK